LPLEASPKRKGREGGRRPTPANTSLLGFTNDSAITLTALAADNGTAVKSPQEYSYKYVRISRGDGPSRKKRLTNTDLSTRGAAE